MFFFIFRVSFYSVNVILQNERIEFLQFPIWKIFHELFLLREIYIFCESHFNVDSNYINHIREIKTYLI